MSAPTLREGAVALVEALRSAGYEAWWAGGCVRDQLMGRTPTDYDVATSARPREVMALFDKTVPVGIQFGVVVVLIAGHQYEVATFRADGVYQDGRRPEEVTWADARADVLRRDFTINGLLYDPIADEVADFVGGQADLEAGCLRAIGDPDLRFAEDHLRILRAVRFAARLGFRIESETWTAMVERAETVVTVSPERIQSELHKILTEGGAGDGFAMLVRAGLLGYVLPEVLDVERVGARLACAQSLSAVASWSALLVEGGPECSERLGRRLRMSRALMRGMMATLQTRESLARYSELGVATRKRLVRNPAFADALQLQGLLVSADQEHAETLALAQRDQSAWTLTELKPAPLLSGQDLSRLGYAPGPWYGEVLEALETKQLEGALSTVEQARAWVAHQARMREDEA